MNSMDGSHADAMLNLLRTQIAVDPQARAIFGDPSKIDPSKMSDKELDDFRPKVLSMVRCFD